MSGNMSLLFGTPLWTFEMLNHAPINVALCNSVAAEKEKDLGVRLSNTGGWQSSGMLHEKAEFRILGDFIASKLGQIGKDYGFGQASNRLRVASMWANVNGHGSSNITHSHQSPSGMPNPLVLSGCYYVKVPENSGDLVLEDYGRPLRYLQLPFQEPNLINSFMVKVAPREGRLLLFPAWMEHRVDENSSIERRISIAFNVALANNPRPQFGDRNGS